MGARHSHHVPPLKDMFRQPLRPTGVGRARLQNCFHQGKFGLTCCKSASADDIANDVQIGFELHLVDAKTLNQLNAQSRQLVAHGGINASITASDPVASFPGQCGQAAHEGSADAQYMNMHKGILGGAQW